MHACSMITHKFGAWLCIVKLIVSCTYVLNLSKLLSRIYFPSFYRVYLFCIYNISCQLMSRNSLRLYDCYTCYIKELKKQRKCNNSKFVVSVSLLLIRLWYSLSSITEHCQLYLLLSDQIQSVQSACKHAFINCQRGAIYIYASV